MTFHVIEEPYDEYERSLVEIIEGISRDARERAEPYMKALRHSRSLKPRRYIVTPDAIPAGAIDVVKPR